MNTQKENNDELDLVSNYHILKNEVINSPASLFSKEDVMNILSRFLLHPEVHMNRVKNDLIDLVDDLKSKLICDIENCEFSIDHASFEINNRNEISLCDYEVDRQNIIDDINSTIDDQFSTYINNL